MNLQEAAAYFELSLRGDVSERTLKTYMERVRKLVAWLGAERDVADVTPLELREWRAALLDREERYSDHPSRPAAAGGLAPTTISGLIQDCRKFFRFLHAERLIDRNPAEQLRDVKIPQRAPKAISAEDRHAMLEAARPNVRDYALFRLLADSGCRAGALCTLRVADLDIAAGRAVAREKGDREVTLHFGDETGAALAAWLQERPSATDWLFPGRRGALTVQGLYLVLRRLAERAGVSERWNPHALRHALAKTMLQEGADLGTVSTVLNHRQIATTHEFYARWTPDEIGERKRRFTKLE